ncbi:hypothetical protein B0H13DRAFT_1852486 [Mycena leptocephala]|nr:hypothetical protein B0H13DRAFT_1852486 [Mycena leptocephala]
MRSKRERKSELRRDKKPSKLKMSLALSMKKEAIRDKRAAKNVYNADPRPIFPPAPPNVNPEQIEESGCAMCGQLTVNTELTPMSELELNWELLDRPGVTGATVILSSSPNFNR